MILKITLLMAISPEPVEIASICPGASSVTVVAIITKIPT
jgi:hypothetical protein